MVDDEVAEMVQLEHIHGIKKSHMKKLKGAGILTAKMLAECTPTKVRSILRISETNAMRLIESARGVTIFIPGTVLESLDKLRPRLMTGIPEINKHFLGGIEQESIFELIGPPRSGKTLWCTQLAVLAQVMYGTKVPEGRVVWYDAAGTYNPNKVREIAYRFRIDPEVAVQNIHHIDITKMDGLSSSLEDIIELHSEHKISLVILDSIQKLMRKLRPRPSLLRFLGTLRAIVIKTKAIFILTSDTRTSISNIAGQIGEAQQNKSVEHYLNIIAYLEITGERQRSLYFHKLSFAPKTWDFFIDFGGIYGDRTSRNAEKYRVQQYMKKLMS